MGNSCPLSMRVNFSLSYLGQQAVGQCQLQGLSQLKSGQQQQLAGCGGGGGAAGASTAAGTASLAEAHAKEGKCQLQGLSQLKSRLQQLVDTGAGGGGAGASTAAGTAGAHAHDDKFQLQGFSQLKSRPQPQPGWAWALKKAPLTRTSKHAITTTRTFLIFISPFRPAA
ncbi:MAG: hypothetical protein ACP5IL_05485 [Syntrophobacteraceae bacterium]